MWTDILLLDGIVTASKFVSDSIQRPEMKIEIETSTVFLKNASGIKLKALETSEIDRLQKNVLLPSIYAWFRWFVGPISIRDSIVTNPQKISHKIPKHSARIFEFLAQSDKFGAVIWETSFQNLNPSDFAFYGCDESIQTAGRHSLSCDRICIETGTAKKNIWLLYICT